MKRGKLCAALPSWLGRGLVVGLLLLAAGCASKGTISGKVTYKDQPVKGGTLSFVTQDGHAYDGNIEKDGTYRVDKVPPGPVRISVVANTPPPVSGGGRGGPPGGGGPPPGVLPPGVPNPYDRGNPEDYTKMDQRDVAKYKDPDKSGLTYDVTAGGQEHDIPLQ
jgi:hypothetical protein